MRFLVPLLTWLVLSTPALAQDAVHHDAEIKLDPAHGSVEIKDQIRITGLGPSAFALSPAFTVRALTVDGQAQTPAHKDGRLRIDLGPPGAHDVRITTHATFTGQDQPPFLTTEGGFLAGPWLAHPPGSLATWVLNGETTGSQKWLTAARLSAEADAADH